MAGVTLMNNQVGYVVAEVMRGKPDVTVTELPSMIRVDGVEPGRLRLRGDRRGAGLGRLRQRRLRGDNVDPLRAHGRPRRPRRCCSRTPRTPRSTSASTSSPSPRREEPMYEKNGEKYFVLDSHLHFWDASPENWVPGAEEYAKGWIECFHAYQGLGPPGDALDARALPEVLGRGLREGRLPGRPRRHGDLPVDVPEGVVHEGLQRHRAERRAARPLPRQADPQRPLGPARGRGRAARSSRPTTRSTASRASSSTRPSGTRARAAGS